VGDIHKVKQSHYRPGQAQRVLRKLRFPDNGTGWWQVVSLTHRLPLPPGNTSGTHRGRVDPKAIVRSEGFYVKEKIH